MTLLRRTTSIDGIFYEFEVKENEVSFVQSGPGLDGGGFISSHDDFYNSEMETTTMIHAIRDIFGDPAVKEINDLILSRRSKI